MSLEKKVQIQDEPQEKENEQQEENKYLSTDMVDPKNLPADRMYLSVSGVIESGECENEETLQVKYSVEQGEDWKLVNGQASGLSQSSSSYSLYVRDIVFNFPFETTLSTSSPYGWPQLVVTVYGPDLFGRSVIKGYGSVHYPTEPGFHERLIRLYKPIPMSWFSGIFGYLDGTIAEYADAEKVIARGEGRDVTRVKSVGQIKVKFQVMKRNFKKFGYG